jgi:hypothetical protein
MGWRRRIGDLGRRDYDDADEIMTLMVCLLGWKFGTISLGAIWSLFPMVEEQMEPGINCAGLLLNRKDVFEQLESRSFAPWFLLSL